MDRHQPLLPENLHKPLDQPHPPGSRWEKQENYDFTACRVLKHRLDSTPKQAGPWPVGNIRGVHSWDAWDVSYRRPFLKCQEQWVTYNIHKNTNSWKNQFCENDYTTQSNLQIQCNHYQITNGISHRITTKNFTICMETQNISNIHSNLKNVKWHWKNQTPWL